MNLLSSSKYFQTCKNVDSPGYKSMGHKARQKCMSVGEGLIERRGWQRREEDKKSKGFFGLTVVEPIDSIVGGKTQ